MQADDPDPHGDDAEAKGDDADAQPDDANLQPDDDPAAQAVHPRPPDVFGKETTNANGINAKTRFIFSSCVLLGSEAVEFSPSSRDGYRRNPRQGCHIYRAELEAFR